MLLRLVALDPAAAMVFSTLAESVASIVPWQVEATRTVTQPREPEQPGQRDAREAVSQLPRGGGGTLVIGITDTDLTATGYEFVFGYALPDRSAAIVSLHRLRDMPPHEWAKDIALNERATKEILHEAGHLLKLQHCPDPMCVMHYSQTLHDTDRKSERFCAHCARELSRLPEGPHEA